MKRPSKRLIIRLCVLAGLVATGLIAIAQAQRVLKNRDSQAAENVEPGNTVVADAAPVQAMPEPIPVVPDAHSASAAVESSPFSRSRLFPADDAGSSEPPVRQTFKQARTAVVRPAGAETPIADAPTLVESAAGGGAAAPVRDAPADPFGLRKAAADEVAAPVVARVADDAPATEQPGVLPKPNVLRERAADTIPADDGIPTPAASRFGARPAAPPAAATPNTPTPADRFSGALPTERAATLPRGSFDDAASPIRGLGAGRVPSAAAGSPADASEGTGRPGESQLEGPQAPSLSLEKTAPSEIQIGKEAQFTLKVRNVGRAVAEDVIVRDQVPQGTRLIDTSPPASPGTDGSIVWQLGAIKPDEEKTVSMKLMPIAEGEIGSVATVAFQARASVRTLATRPELVLQHSAPATVLIGEQVTFRIKLSNPGTGAATGIVIQEDIPEGLSHSAGRELEFEVGTLQPGESRELDLVMKAAKAGVVQNVLSAFGDASLSAEHRLKLEVVAPQLQVSIAGPKKRYLERRATYTVSVANPGTAAAKDVELAAYLPKGMKFIETNNAGQYDSQRHAVYWSLEELPPNQMGEVALTALPVEAGQQKLRVEGRANMGLVHENEQSVLVEGLAALFFEVGDVEDPIEVGGETTYEVRIVNQGSKAATNVQLAVLIPPEMKPLGGEGSTRGVVQGQRIVFEPLGRLAPKADTTYRFRAQGLRPGDQRVRVQLLTDDLQLPVTKEESTHVYSDE